MAFSKGKESTEAAVVKRYIGVAPVKVLAINPTKEKLEELYGTTLDKDVEYTGEQDGVKTARIDFIVKTSDKCAVDMTTKVTFFLRKEFMFNKDNSKVKVMDKYARTAWVTKEECKAHAIPQYSNGPANISAEYRPLYRGEEEMTLFVKNWINIDDVMTYNKKTKTWSMVDNPSSCEAQFDTAVLEAAFEGKFDKIQEMVDYQPNNVVQVMFGVKTNDEGKEFQTAFTRMTLRAHSTNYDGLEAALNEAKSNGAYPTTEFKVCTIEEYAPAPTNLETTEPANTDWF